MMNDQPLVSIVTPSYNQGQFLEDTILSVLNQDYPNIEYIIIDGGSNDGSVDIIKKYEDRLAFWISEKDKGQTHALIKGFGKAKGQFITWLCSDDLLEPSMVTISVDFHLRHPDIAVTFGDRIRIDSRGHIYTFQRYPKFRSWFVKFGFSLPQETTLLKKDAYEASGGLDEHLQMAMDFDLWCRITRYGKIYHIPAFLGRFRAHETNKSSVFTKQAGKTGFSKGFPEEFSVVFKSHFGYRPSAFIMSLGKALRYILAFYDRRTSAYQRDSNLIKTIHAA